LRLPPGELLLGSLAPEANAREQALLYFLPRGS
jgi:hypothetical protein